MNHVGAIILVLLVAGLPAEGQTSSDSGVFKRVFGISRILPADLVEQVKQLPSGEKIKRDTNNDGKIDELWYLDTDKRHTVAPLVVCVVDEDGDMDAMQRGDLDSDIYFWDHRADGFIDCVTDYQDDDKDGDVDQMGIFYDKKWPDEKDDITVWWAVDIGDDNMLWFDVNGNYEQPLCQWRTHFSGDELFYQFRLAEGDTTWMSMWEDPFGFYDADNDRCSETVVRISAKGTEVENLRYSIDADDDAKGRNTHNYDFSITAFPGEGGMTLGAEYSEIMTVRGIGTSPVLPWSKTREFALKAPWGKAMLTWDELNSNTDGNVEQDPNERWEGVLNHASKHGDFVQVGGPPCSAFNKRVEVSEKPASPLQLYFNPRDRRFHLLGAKYGYLDVDYNLDGVVDAAYTWADDDGDGMFDTRAADLNADGTPEWTQLLKSNDASSKLYPPTFEDLVPEYRESLLDMLGTSQGFVDLALAILGASPDDVSSVIQYFAGPLAGYHLEGEIGLTIQNTPGGARLYMDLVRDRLFAHLRAKLASDSKWPGVEEAYWDGRYLDATVGLEAFLDPALVKSAYEHPFAMNGRSLSRSMSIMEPAGTYNNSLASLSVNALKSVRPDFNPRNCVVVNGNYWLAWRPIPHQVDDWDFDGVEKVIFPFDQRRSEERMIVIFYEPEGEVAPPYPALTRAVLDTPAYVAWESDAGAYRFYTGQFDFFGKHESRLLPRPERLLYPIKDVNYHAEQPWGMDALHVNKTSGLGGLTLYVGDKEYPIQSPAGEGHVKFEHRVLGAGPVRAAVEIVAKNVIPESPEKDVVLRCYIYAGHPETMIDVRLPKGLGDAMIAPGLLKLAEEKRFSDMGLGCMGTWGRQGDDIGEIGLAVMVPPGLVQGLVDLPDEQRLKCSLLDLQSYNFRYWIIGTWRRGMQYPIAPDASTWESMLKETDRHTLD